MLTLKKSMAVLALLSSASDVEAARVNQKDDKPVTMSSGPSLSMMDLENLQSNSSQQLLSRGNETFSQVKASKNKPSAKKDADSKDPDSKKSGRDDRKDPDSKKPGREKFIYINAAPGKHTHTLIFFHGAGDPATIFLNLFQEGAKLNYPNLKVILPEAPFVPVTVIDGRATYSWFDIHFFRQDGDMTEINMLKNGETKKLAERIQGTYSQSDLLNASDLQMQLIKEEAAKLNGDFSKIIIGGFSQGGFTSMTTLLRWQGPQPLGGVISLSGMLAYDKARKDKSAETISRIQRTPLFMFIGEKDVKFVKEIADFTYQPLKKIYDDAEDPDLKKNWQYGSEKNLAHSVSDSESTLLDKWLQKRIGF